MNTFFLAFLIFTASISFSLEGKEKLKSDMVIATTQIKLKEFPYIWNPSLLKTKEGFLLSFRYCLAPHKPWISYIGVVMLNEALEVISKPQLLNSRRRGDKTPSQAEDARLFVSNDTIYVLYNDNMEVENPSTSHRRDMYLAKLSFRKSKFHMSKPIKLYHPREYNTRRVQKNWVPFDWRGSMMLGYLINPHEIIHPDFITGECSTIAETPYISTWNWGERRGGTPAIEVDGNYLAFFHSMNVTDSEASRGVHMYHYYMGAYTFSLDPPFYVKAMSHSPIMADGFYTRSSYDKRVIFPGGFAVVGSTIYLAYGKDDNEAWIAIIDKKKLLESLKEVKSR
ncbi:MAG: hypothetical protein H0W50_00890 [Parachlamydiaceae bacterium]|nr:hypothetical protein [Parachlamydiaceae bacterium]